MRFFLSTMGKRFRHIIKEYESLIISETDREAHERMHVCPRFLNFTHAKMHVNSLQPNSGPTAGSNLVTLRGRFESASAGAVHCLFHVKSGLPSVSVVAMVHGPTQISCTAPACPPESCAEDISYASFAVRAEGSAPSRSSLIYTYFAPEKALEAQLLQVTPSGIANF